MVVGPGVLAPAVVVVTAWVVVGVGFTAVVVVVDFGPAVVVVGAAVVGDELRLVPLPRRTRLERGQRVGEVPVGDVVVLSPRVVVRRRCR